MLPVVIVVVYILVIAVFLAVLILAVLNGQRSQLRQLGELRRELDLLSARLRSVKQQEADLRRQQARAAKDKAARDLYEYGGC